MKTLVILNEQHSLLPDQERVLNEELRRDWEIFPVPKNGWTIEQMVKEVMPEIGRSPVVFVSPPPALILFLAGIRSGVDVFVMHNDKRVKEEVNTPSGIEIISKVAPEGWKLV